jgi:hypothetical protein
VHCLARAAVPAALTTTQSAKHEVDAAYLSGYKAGHQAGLMEAGAAAATRAGPQRRPSTAQAQRRPSTAASWATTFLHPAQARQQGSPAHSVLSQHSSAKVAGSSMQGGGKAPVSVAQQSQQVAPAPAQPSTRLMSVATRQVSNVAKRAVSAADAAAATAAASGAAAAGAAAGVAGMGWEPQPLANIGGVLGGGGEAWEKVDWRIGVGHIRW